MVITVLRFWMNSDIRVDKIRRLLKQSVEEVIKAQTGIEWVIGEKRQSKEMKSCRATVNKYIPQFSHLTFEEGLVGCFALKKQKQKTVVWGF